MNEMATKAKNRKKTSLNDIPSLAQFQNDFRVMFFLFPFTEIAKTFPLCWTKWLPELKIEKALKDISMASGRIWK